MAIATPTAWTSTTVTVAEARADSIQNDLALSLEEAASYVLFKHTPLDRTQRSIRLVSVHPVLSSTGRICCSIKQVSDDQRRYRCLSYTWGLSKEYHVINLNGRGFAVRSHLWRFLNAARLVYADQEFWIDALCINQANIGEVNHQIQLMDQIFSNAMDVIIWLGDGDSGGYRSALSFLAEQRDKRTQCLPKSSLGARGSSSDFWPEKSVMQSLLALCEDEYWGRTWIIQEVLLAKRLYLMSGTTVTAWSHLADFLLWGIESSSAITGSPVDLAEEDLHGPAKARLWDSRARLFCLERMMSSGEMHQFSLRDLLVRFGRSNCSDVRDRILGLLALADYGSAKKNGEFRVDYSLSPAQLFAYLMSFYETASVRNGRTLLYILELDLESASSVPIKLEFLMKDEHVSTSLFVQSYEDEEERERVCKYCGIDVSIMTSKFADGTICCFFQDEVEEHLVFDREGRFQAFALRKGSDAASETAIQKFDRKASFLTNMCLRREVRQRIVVRENGRSESEDEISYRLDVDERALAFLLYKGRVE
jgi:hypothetical protein